ncbi:MAG: hypothetical protein RIM80_25650 [Alphaproteobacteria bacterium]
MLKSIVLLALLAAGGAVLAFDLAPEAIAQPSPYLLMAASGILWLCSGRGRSRRFNA